jgi:hypothetical protein
MEPEGSLPHSQVPATCPYPEPARSSPYLHIPLPADPSYYRPPIYAWVAKTWEISWLNSWPSTRDHVMHSTKVSGYGLFHCRLQSVGIYRIT